MGLSMGFVRSRFIAINLHSWVLHGLPKRLTEEIQKVTAVDPNGAMVLLVSYQVLVISYYDCY